MPPINWGPAKALGDLYERGMTAIQHPLDAFDHMFHPPMPEAPPQQMNWTPQPNAEQQQYLNAHGHGTPLTEMKKPLPKGK